jgi:hypothetical protein
LDFLIVGADFNRERSLRGRRQSRQSRCISVFGSQALQPGARQDDRVKIARPIGINACNSAKTRSDVAANIHNLQVRSLSQDGRRAAR